MKYIRQSKIIEIIENEVIETQEEIAEKLKEAGFDVTQATVSRDIKELRLVKVQSTDGKSRYAQIKQNDNSISNRLFSVFVEGFVSCEFAMNIVVVKTLSGMADAVAEFLDNNEMPEVIGSIAGDNNIMLVCRSEEHAGNLVKKLIKMSKA